MNRTQQLISNYRNAKRFLRECNSIAILNQYRGAALVQCAKCRREILDAVLAAKLAQ